MRGVTRLRFRERTVNDSFNIGTNFSMREKESSHGKKHTAAGTWFTRASS
jgi:hypothetical protein